MPDPEARLPVASIVIVNFNGAEFVAASIETALAQRVPCEVIVVDNASTDDSLRVLRAIPGIRLVENDRNAGFGAGANLGAAHARSDYVAFLNSDALARPDWIETIVPWMRWSNIDFASSVIASGDGVWFAGGSWIPAIGAALTRDRVSPFCAWISGCALVVRRSSFETLNGFEESFFLYFEDVDLCLRASNAGFRLGVLDRALVRHDVAGRSGVSLGFKKLEIAYRAKGMLLRKHAALRYLPLALAFQSIVSPLGQGVPLRRLPDIWRAFYGGFGEAKRLRGSPRRPRVGILANTLEDSAGPTAGGHVHFLEVARRWPWADVVIFAPESGRAAFSAAVPEATFTAMPSWDRGLQNKALLFLFRSAVSLLRFRELHACDVLVATSPFLPDVFPIVVTRGKKSLLTVHHLMEGAGSREGPFVRNAIAFAAERVSLALAARTFGAVACLSRLVASELERIGVRLPAVITTNGVEHIDPPVDAARARHGAVFVGRLHPTKGVDDLVRAWRIVVDALPSERLSLIGASDDPAFERELDALIAQLELGANVRKLGRVDDEQKLAMLYGAKAFAFASKEEGWGIALAEAMRAGLPCVTYALPVFDEVFPQGRLSAPIGDVAAFAEQLIRLLSDDELNRSVGDAAAALAESFSWQRAAEIEGAAVRALL